MAAFYLKRNKNHNQSMEESKVKKQSPKTNHKNRTTEPARPRQQEKSSGEELSSLRDLFLDELRDLYNAENQLVKALPKVVAAVSSSELKETIEEHLEETRGHVDRLEQVFKQLGEKPGGTHCDGMEGLLEEGKKMMKKKGDDSVIDAGIISAAQRVEHYEIAGYGCVHTFAKRLGEDAAAELLSQTLKEEKQADEKLTEIAEGTVNTNAAAGN